jgi:hypothetical protein
VNLPSQREGIAEELFRLRFKSQAGAKTPIFMSLFPRA